jgi:hypothetical protein
MDGNGCGVLSSAAHVFLSCVHEVAVLTFYRVYLCSVASSQPLHAHCFLQLCNTG